MLRRAARHLLYAGTVAVVLGLGKFHAARHGYDFTDSFRFGWSLVYIGLLCLTAYGVGLPELAGSWRSAVAAAAGSTVVAAVAVSAAQLVLGSAVLPRFVVFGAAAILIPLYAACARLARGARARHEERDRVVLVGRHDEAERLADELARFPERPASVVDTLSVDGARPIGFRSRPLVETAVGHGASVIVLDREAQADEVVVAQAASLHEAGVRVRSLTQFYDEWLGKLPVSELERASLFFDIGEVHRARYGRIKRVLDIGVGLAGLPVLLVATPLVALGNRFGNRGPLFFRQPRVGRDNRVFSILKFRTMTAGDAAGAWTEVDDARITRFGALLRRAHIDELPQVINILRGDLSIVGPRPEQPHYVQELHEKIPFYDLRHLVRPGLTGWAQVKYAYGASELDALEKLQYEFHYLRHQRLGLDLRVMARTIRHVVGREGR
jgi:lipopolysaccharide/colanic/teichoic acid biosynthesis glycosyltransferase